MLRSNLIDLIQILSPNVGAVNMVSNGSLINETIVNDLKQAGINIIQISLDGINPMQHDTFRCHPGAFEMAINALKAIKSKDIETYVSFIPNKLNYRTFPEFLHLMQSFGVSQVRVMPLIPMGRGSKIENLILSSDEYIQLQSMILGLKNKYIRHGLQIEWGDPLDHFNRLPNNETTGYKNCQYCIKSNGDITITPYLPITVGNVRKHSLKEYWNNGYDNIWYNKDFKNTIKSIETIYDINKLYTKLNYNTNNFINIMREKTDEI